MKYSPLLAFVFTLAACATIPAPPVPDGGPVAIGESARVGTLVATPNQVTEDSRCPTDVQCVWAGRVILSTQIDGGGWFETVPLTLGQPHATHGATITLVSVTPAKRAGGTINPGDYRFTFAGGN